MKIIKTKKKYANNDEELEQQEDEKSTLNKINNSNNLAKLQLLISLVKQKKGDVIATAPFLFFLAQT